MKAFALALLFIAASARADTWVTVPLASYHFERGRDYCEVNPGIGIETDITKNTRFHAGGYHNSNCRPSTYLCADYVPQLGSFRLGGALCALTGYQKETRAAGETSRKDKVIPAPMLVLAYERKTWGLNLILVPPESLLKAFGHEPSEDEFKGNLGLVWKKRF